MFVRAGRQVAIDFQIPGDIFLLVSNQGYEFGTKDIIAEKLQDFGVGSNRKSRATEASTANASLVGQQLDEMIEAEK